MTFNIRVARSGRATGIGANMKRARNQSGFTLVELMVTAAILVILTAIALPSYNGFVARTVRTQAKSALLLVADRQEQFFLDNKSYSGSLVDLGYSADPTAVDRDGTEVEAGSEAAVYEIALLDPAATSFTIAAKPLAAQAKADKRCGTLSLDENGRRDSTGPVADCW